MKLLLYSLYKHYNVVIDIIMVTNIYYIIIKAAFQFLQIVDNFIGVYYLRNFKILKKYGDI